MSNKSPSLETIKSNIAQIKQSFSDEQDAIKAAHEATLSPIESYQIAPSSKTRAAALSAIETRNHYELLLDIFPEDSLEYMQKQAVQSYFTENTSIVADALDNKLQGIIASYPAVKDSLLSKIADLGTKALSLAGIERANAFATRDKNEDFIISIESQVENCKNSILYFRGNPNAAAFTDCEGNLGLLEHELNSQSK